MAIVKLPPAPGSASSEPDVPYLKTFPIPEACRSHLGCVLVIPGGGYSNRSAHEGEPIALAFNALGFNAALLEYRIAPCTDPAPLADAVHAMRFIRRHAAAWHVDPAHIAVCGFSAGGHLAADVATRYSAIPADSSSDPSARPDAMILSYAVLDADAGHRGSFDNLVGRHPATPAQYAALSPARNVVKTTPPAFIWQTTDDDCVPVENSLRMAAALRAVGVPFELHSFQHGYHGIGIAGDPKHGGYSRNAAQWPALAASWLEELGFPRAAQPEA